MLLVQLALFAGCNPQDGELTEATYAAFLSQASPNILPFTQVGDPVPESFLRVDCRELREDEEGRRLEGVDYEAECTDDEDPIEPGWFYWLDQYAYYVAAGPVVPWRVEAVRNIEGDIQVLFHFETDHIGDSRLGFTIDPDFQPQECVGTETSAQLVDIDGGNWLEHWSEGQTNDAGDPVTLYLLNASSYQFNPSNFGDYWFLDEVRLAGTSFGRFGSEDIYTHGVDYNDPDGTPFHFPAYAEGASPFNDAVYEGEDMAEVQEAISEEFAENGKLATLGKVAAETSPVEIVFEDNSWRPASETDVGLSGFLGVSTNWVKIDPNPDFEAGKSKGTPKFSGEFQIALDGYDAGGFVFAHGKFKIFNIRDDADYGYENLEEIKRAENNTPTCPTN